MKENDDQTNRTNRTNRSDEEQNPQPIRASGGYRKLRSFQTSTIVYDATEYFCNRFIDRRSRTHDQMVQAARSGRQNIGEGSLASATSSQTELRLVNVARASLGELQLDYEDFLRHRHLPLWDKNDPKALAVREIGKQHPFDHITQTDKSDTSDLQQIFGPYAVWITHENPAIVANTILCLIHQANYLLDRQRAGLEQLFVNEGGYSERLAAARIQHRQQQKHPEQEIPPCPVCGKPMQKRTARQGKNVGAQFWGCSTYPECKGTRSLTPTDR